MSNMVLMRAVNTYFQIYFQEARGEKKTSQNFNMRPPSPPPF